MTPAVARRILGCSQNFLEQQIANGLMPLHPASLCRPLLSRDGVERLLGRELTADDIVTAWRRGGSRRQINKRYYIKRLLAKAAQLACAASPISP